MTRLFLLAALPPIALAGCEKEPDFSASYAAQEAELIANAGAMQHDLSQRITASREAARVMAEAKADNASPGNDVPEGSAR